MATSKDALKKDEAEEAPAPPKKSRKVLFIILGAVVVSIVVGLFAGKLVFGTKHGAATDDQTAEEVQSEEPEQTEPQLDPRKPPVFVNLEPFTVNLQSENGAEQFLQVVTTLRVTDDKMGEILKQYMPQIRHEILSLMSAKHASEITSPDGREALAEEIRIAANGVLGFTPPAAAKKKKKGKEDPESTGPVMSVFFTQFIVQ